MYRPHLVPASTTKNITLPFAGLYHSHTGEGLTDAIEQMIESAEVSEGLADSIYALINKMLDNRQYNQLLAESYAGWLADQFDYDLSLPIVFTDAKYHPMNMQNRGDDATADIDVSKLPSIDSLSSIIEVDIWQDFKDKARDRLTSYDGFISFYDPNVEPLKDALYANWNDPYIAILIEVIADHLDSAPYSGFTLSNLDLRFATELSEGDGFIESLFTLLSAEACDQLNDLLYP